MAENYRRLKDYGLIGNLESYALPESVESLAKFFKGLGDRTRLRIVGALLEKERNVSQLIKLIAVPQSNISNHLSCLKWCGYITSRREGITVYYQITDERVGKIVQLACEIIADHAENLYVCTRLERRTLNGLNK